MDFRGRTVIVTGAGKGIGRRTAALLSQRGARVVGLSRTRGDLESLAALTDAHGFVVDLANVEETRRVVAQALPADYLVNCAGINILEPFLEMKDTSFDAVQAVNVRAAAVVSQIFARDLVSRKAGGAIVNVSSVASRLGTGSSVAYAASKAALETMSFSLARSLAPEVRVNVVAPGHTRTPWHEQARGAAGAAEVEKRYSAIAPLQAVSEAQDVADAIVWLIEGARRVTGQVVWVDGGMHIAAPR